MCPIGKQADDVVRDEHQSIDKMEQDTDLSGDFDEIDNMDDQIEAFGHLFTFVIVLCSIVIALFAVSLIIARYL